MKKQITWGELLLAMIPVFAAIGASYISLQKSQATLEVRVNYLESNYQKLDAKIDRLAEDTKTIRIMLEQKENRKE